MINKFRKNRNKIITFFLISLLFKPLWLFNNQNLGIPGDDMSHWLHSATIAFDQDLDYQNDYEIQSEIFNPKTNTPIHPPGAGYLASPFVFIFSLLDKFIETTNEDLRVNPIRSFSFLGFFFAGIFYTYFGSLLISKVVKKYKNKNTGLILLCGLLSSLVHFVTTRFLMSHAVEFFLCCALIYLFEKNDKLKFTKIDFTKLMLIYFCLAITRPSTFLYSLILVGLYRKKFSLGGKTFLTNFIQFTGFSSLYVILSRKLYQENYMLLNTYGRNMDEYVGTFNLEQILNGIIKLPNLFISPNMGVIFSTPIIFLGLFFFFFKYLKDNIVNSNKLYLFLYLGASVFPLLVWQGREVAYGQRLLIGIIPICIVITCKYLKEKNLITLTKFLTFFTYLGYLFFYSSDKLTLREGATLWGTKVGFTAENYYIEVIKGLAEVENIISVLLRNIYTVDFLKFFNLRNFMNNSSLIDKFNPEKFDKFLSFSDSYYNLSLSYLVLANLIIFLFSYYYTKLLFSSSKN